MQSLMAQDECSKMAEESCLLKEDGYLNADTNVKQIVYHPTLNVILICSSSGTVHVLDVNSGFVLQSTGLSAENQKDITCKYIGGLDRVLFCDGQSLGARSDYNGVLLLDTILQKTVTSGRDDVKIELLLSEAIILKQCLLNSTSSGVDYILNELTLKIQEAQKQCKKGIKAQKWNTVCLELPLEFLKTGTNNVMSELLMKNQHSPEISVTSAIQERALELLGEPAKPMDKSTMASEAKRRETFAHWPHMDYKWALPDQMAQAGFYHQPNTIGDDRAMCFTCSVCLVCWEKTDEPWSEHERHSPTCPFVVGEYTQNVPLSVTYATNPAVDATFRGGNVNTLGNSSVPDLIATSNNEGLISVFDVSGRLKRTHSFYVTQYDSHLLEKFTEDFGVPNVSSNAKESKSCTDKTITALSIVGDKQPKPSTIRPSIICGLKMKCSDMSILTSLNIMEIDNVTNISPKTTCLYIVVYDFQFTKDLENVSLKKEVNETEETNSDKVLALFEPPDLSFISQIKTFENNLQQQQELENLYQNLIPGDSDQIYLPPLSPKSLVSTPKWTSDEHHTGPRNLHSDLQKNETDSAQATSLQYPQLPLYSAPLHVEKFKKSISDHIMEMNNPKEPKKLNYSRAVQCISIPNKYKNRDDLSISDIIPSQDGCFILVVLKSNTNHKSSVLLLYALDFNHNMVKVVEEAVYSRELSPQEKPMEVGTISLFDKNNDCCNKIGPDGLVILVGHDGAVRVIELSTLKTTAIAKLESEKFVSAVYCNSLERLCASTEKGSLHFFALNDTDADSTEDHDDEDLANTNPDMPNASQPMLECMDGVESAHYFQDPEIISFSELKRLKQLSEFEPLKSGFNPVVPACWSEMQQAQRQRRHPQHMQKDREQVTKTWRLQTDTTTFDEHIFEITLPIPTYIEHVDFSFTLHNARGVPRVEVTLLRQNTTSIGHKRDVSFAVDDCVSFDQLESLQNPVTSQEYLRQHNADILAGPIDIGACLDLTEQTGCVMLTSPKLFKSRNRNLLLHLKSVCNKDDARANRFTQTSVSEYVGCDCLHEVTITVYNSTHTEIPHEKSLRCSMLESQIFVESLLMTALKSQGIEIQGAALDILVWVATIRLAKSKCSNENNQQVEFLMCVKKNLEDLLESCLLQANRSIAHKCVKLLVVCSDGVSMLTPADNLNTAILTALLDLMNKIYEIKSSGALHWLLILLYKVSKNTDLTKRLASKCIELLSDIAKQLNKRSNPYHLILRSRYGLYGCPLEPELFDIEPPSPIKGSSTLLTYASIVTGEHLNSTPDIYSSFINKDYLDPKDVLLNTTETKVKLKNIMPAMLFRGLLETEPLHYTCVSASDGTRVERLDASSGVGSNGVPITVTQVVSSGTKKIEMMDIFNEFDFVISYNKPKKDYLNVPSTSHATVFTSSDDSPQVYFNTDNLKNEDFAKMLMENIQESTLIKEAEEVGKPVRHFEEALAPYKAFSWQQLLVTPAQQVIVVERMHSGARRFVTLDFGQPILLTDIFLPACVELLSVSIDIWLKGDDVDSQRLVLSTDIGTRNLIFCDLQPPPLCRYLKITAVGRYGMSSTRCRIPIGCFYGHLVVLPDEIPNEHLPNITPVTDEDLKKQLSALEILFEDVSCRYSLSCSKLKNLLQPFLMSDATNAAHLAAFMDIMRDKNISPSFDDMKIFNAYQEAIMFQHQLNIIRNVMNRIEVGLKMDKVQTCETSSLVETCSDKLRSIAEVLLEILLKLDCNPKINMQTCQDLFQGFCITQKSHVQFLAATVLDHSCRKKPFWGVFLANTLSEMFSSNYNARFPQDRVFVLLSYLVKRCSERSVAFDETLKMIAITMKPLQQDTRALLGVTVDLSLLGWLLLFLSLQMDLSKGNSRSSNRWSWVVGELSSKGSEVLSSNYKKKLQKRFLLSKQQYDNDANKSIKKNYNPTQSLTEKLQQALKGPEGLFNKLKQVRIKNNEGQEPKQFGKRRREASMETGGEKSVQISDPKFIDPAHSLAVVTKLIQLLLNVDHSCSADLFVLSCKVIARLAKLSKLPLSLCMDMKSLLKLINLCIGSELPFISHALVCLLQDILEIGNVQIPCSDNDAQTSTGWRSDIFRDVEDLCKSFEIEDAFLTEPVVKQGKTTTTNNNHLSSVYESEDSEIEDFFDELIETSSPVTKKSSKHSTSLYGSSCAIDQRLESSVEAQTEITLRRLIQHNANLSIQAINSPVNVVESERPNSNWPPELLPANVIPRTFNHNIKMVAACFDELFKNLESLPVSKIEQILQLWLTLNCQFSHDKFNPSTMPSISLTTKAINSLITAVSWCTNLSLRAWCLTLQTLTLVCNVTIGSLDGEEAEDDETEISIRMFGKTSVIVNHKDFVQMFLRLLSGNGIQFCEQGLVGPAVCSAMHDFLVRLQMRCDVATPSSLPGGKLKSYLLKVVYQLVQLSGPLSSKLGPLDAQCKFFQSLVSLDYNNADLSIAMSIFESAAVLVLSHVSNNERLKCVNIGEKPGTSANSFNGIFASVLGTENNKHDKPISRDVLLMYLLKLVENVVQTPLPPSANNTVEQEYIFHMETDPEPVSQTDESKAEQIHPIPTRTNPQVPCLADTALQHHPSIIRLYKALATCKSTSLSMIPYSYLNMQSFEDLRESGSIGDAVFNVLGSLSRKASQKTLLMEPLLMFLSEVPQLSEPLIWFIIQVLDSVDSLKIFIEADGIQVICRGLVESSTAPNTINAYGNLAMVMQHFIGQNSKTEASVIGVPSNNKKQQQVSMENNLNLINFAPQGTIRCLTSTTAHAPEILIQGGQASHRRARAPQWSYHFYPEEAHADLQIQLPSAILLREVQILPHQGTLVTCPAAVSLEVSSAGPAHLVPACSPLTTSGMSFIRLHLNSPEVVNCVQIRLYKPRDASNIGLSQIRLLGSTAFGGIAKPQASDLLEEENHCKFSLSWLRLLYHCCTISAKTDLEKTVILKASEIENLLSTCCGLLLRPTHIPSLYLGNLEKVLCELSLITKENSLETIRMLLENKPNVIESNTMSNLGNDKTLINSQASQSASELLYRICTYQDEDTCHRVNLLLTWLQSQQEQATLTTSSCNSKYISTIASILWNAKQTTITYDLKSLISREFFDCVYNLGQIYSENENLKNAIDSLLCSICYLRTEYYYYLLAKMDILTPDESTDFIDESESMTDDSKCSFVYNSEENIRYVIKSSDSINITLKKLETIGLVSRSPSGVQLLLDSTLPKLLIQIILNFCEDVSANFPVSLLDTITAILNFFSQVSEEKLMRDWLGSMYGSKFWLPLLKYLCQRNTERKSSLRSEAHTKLEEVCVKFLIKCCMCHPNNQNLLARVLCEVIILQTNGISGFLRRLILQLLLENEKIPVSIKADETLYKNSTVLYPYLPQHPAIKQTHDSALLNLPTNITIADILEHYLSFSSCLKSEQIHTKKEFRSRIKSFCVALDSDLSVAAGVTAKDKRIKDAKNIMTSSSSCAGMPVIKKKRNARRECAEAFEGRMVKCPVLSDQSLPLDVTLAQILKMIEEKGAYCDLTRLHLTICQSKGAEDENNKLKLILSNQEPLSSTLQVFSSMGGLALLARHLPALPNVVPETIRMPVVEKSSNDLSESDWIKVDGGDDIYEDIEECPLSSTPTKVANTTPNVPSHSLTAFSLFLRLPGYAEVLLRDMKKALCLLRLVLGVTDDGEGSDIFQSPVADLLPTLPFEVLRELYDSSPLSTDDGTLLRRLSITTGVVHLILGYLGIFTHQTQTNQQKDSKARDDKGQLYWAKGTGFGTGSTQQSWNVEQALMKQRSEEEHVTVLLQVLSSYVNPNAKSEEELQSEVLPPIFEELLNDSSLLPALSSYLRNDSVLDMARHIPLYRAALELLRAMTFSCQLVKLLLPQGDSQGPSVSSLLQNMKTCVDTYASKLRSAQVQKSSKKTNCKSSGSKYKYKAGEQLEVMERDEGLAMLMLDIRLTAILICTTTDKLVGTEMSGSRDSNVENTVIASVEEQYLKIMKCLQFDTFEMIQELTEGGYKFVISHHYENNARSAGESSHPARVKRLAQEAVTLATSLPLSHSSSVFVRCDTDRLDIMKVLITGPAETPYANGCFEFDVFFPPEYPVQPMMINLETTGHHTVRFNPNLYNDGKVCLSVLNTWHGRPEEKWNAQTSSFLQVLVSIQSLILVSEPYFNEPGYERSRGTPAGTQNSKEYNANICQATVRWAMLEQLINPCPCFKDVINTHFYIKRHEIIEQCEKWLKDLESDNGEKRTARTVAKRNALATLDSFKKVFDTLKSTLMKLKPPEGFEEDKTSMEIDAVNTEKVVEEIDVEKMVSDMCD